jgi:hypothetical protein
MAAGVLYSNDLDKITDVVDYAKVTEKRLQWLYPGGCLSTKGFTLWELDIKEMFPSMDRVQVMRAIFA